MSCSKFGLQLELNVRFSPQFGQPCIFLNSSTLVQYVDIEFVNSTLLEQFLIFFSPTYHKHNFLTPVIENGKPGFRPELDLSNQTYYLITCVSNTIFSSRKLWGQAPYPIHHICNPPWLSDVGTRMHNELNVVYNWLVEGTGVKRLDAISVLCTAVLSWPQLTLGQTGQSIAGSVNIDPVKSVLQSSQHHVLKNIVLCDPQDTIIT
jgi:hypothetical protein